MTVFLKENLKNDNCVLDKVTLKKTKSNLTVQV